MNKFRRTTICLVGVALLATALVPLFGGTATAAFNKNHIISDSVFDFKGSMTAGQIDNFLNTFPRSCISPNSGFAAKKPIGYSPSNSFSFGDYVTAGNVIYAAAQAYDLNPQVLLATLEKEQSLVTGRNSTTYCGGTNHKYAAAMGYGCPDSGGSYSYSGLSLYRRNGTVQSSVSSTCVNTAAKAGFSQQTIRAAWLLKFAQQRSQGRVNWAIVRGSWDNSDDPQSCYSGPMTKGTYQRCPSGSFVFYDGMRSIDGQTVQMGSGATAALYWYTPHFHGNENFVALFEDWFGSTQVTAGNDRTIVGDWDGDGDDTVGHKRGDYILLDNNNDGQADFTYFYGSVNDIPIVGDWDGDGDDTVGLKVGNKYFINNELDGTSEFRFFYGDASWTPIVGDWDNDGFDTVGLKVGNKYFINNELDGTSQFRFFYGDASWIPIVGDWDGDGDDTVGLKQGNKYFVNNELDGTGSFRFYYGDSSWLPIVGDWDDNNFDTVGLKASANKYFINNELDGTSEFRFYFTD